MRHTIFTAALLFCFQIALSQTEQQIQNQTTFTRLFGYVRYFHPSDEASHFNWDKFAIYGSEQVDKCKTPQELKETLNKLFTPVAPSVRVFDTKENLQFNAADITPPSGTNHKTVVWQHLGVGLTQTDDMYTPYMSARTNRPLIVSEGGRSTFGTFTLHLPDGKQYAGKEFEFTAKVKIVKGTGSGQMWARVDKGKAVGFFDNMDDRPIKSKSLQEYTIKGTIDKDITEFYFGVLLNGSGELLTNNLKVKVKDGNEWKEVFATDFSKDAENEYPQSANAFKGKNPIQPGYEITVAADTIGRSKCVRIKSSDSSGKETYKEATHHLKFSKVPHFGEYIKKEIGSGLSCIVPLVLYDDGGNTFPKADTTKFYLLRQNVRLIPDSAVSGNNLYCRLGDIAISWNIFQHFFVYFDIAKTNWMEDLKTALNRAYKDKTEMDFQETLQKMTAKLKDGHVWVRGSFAQKNYYLPLTWEWIENKLVITKVSNDSLPVHRGDVVTQVDGLKADEYYKKVEENISAATKGWLEERANSESAEGWKNTECKLTVVNEKGVSRDITLKRSITESEHYELGKNSETIKKISDNIYYVNLDGVTDSVLDNAMPDLAKCKSIIFDLRGYPSVKSSFLSNLMTVKDTSDDWMRIPRIIYPDHDSVYAFDKANWKLEPEKPHLGAKIFFLTNGSAISYAESVMGYIEHYKLATIIGQPTAGTNGNINPFTLPGGYTISWTGMRVVKHDGSQHHGIGILPNVPVTKTIKGVREGRDEFLDKVIELAKQ